MRDAGVSAQARVVQSVPSEGVIPPQVHPVSEILRTRAPQHVCKLCVLVVRIFCSAGATQQDTWVLYCNVRRCANNGVLLDTK